MDNKCKHCGKRIIWVNYAWNPGWVHQPEGASFQDSTHEYCHTTKAEPK